MSAADEVADALAAALDAYTDGDVSFALEELDFARAKLLEMKADSLNAFLPEPLPGWTREDDTDMAASMGFMGGGSGAGATYFEQSSGESISITLIADSPMVAGIGAMIANASAMGASIERVGRQKFAVQDGQMTALIANRVLVQADGADVETMTALLETMDFRELAGWGL